MTYFLTGSKAFILPDTTREPGTIDIFPIMPSSLIEAFIAFVKFVTTLASDKLKLLFNRTADSTCILPELNGKVEEKHTKEGQLGQWSM